VVLGVAGLGEGRGERVRAGRAAAASGDDGRRRRLLRRIAAAIWRSAGGCWRRWIDSIDRRRGRRPDAPIQRRRRNRETRHLARASHEPARSARTHTHTASAWRDDSTPKVPSSLGFLSGSGRRKDAGVPLSHLLLLSPRRLAHGCVRCCSVLSRGLWVTRCLFVGVLCGVLRLWGWGAR